MISVLPSLWDSSLEDSSRLSPTSFVPSEALGVAHHDAGLQLVALTLQEQDIFGSQENLPSIDEALFDIDEVPELEDADFEPAPLDDLMLEVPPLEGEWLSQEWSKQTALEAETCPEVVTQAVLFKEPVAEILAKEQTTSLMPPTVYYDEQLVAKEEIIDSSPVTLYVESCGSESPMSCYSATSEDHPNEKKRRVSQISVSSYCSSAGDSAWSPSASDSDAESKRGGRKSRYTAEDRKERKKAQNRTAAERYRLKRKLQEETISEEEQKLIDGNAELKIEVTKLEAEVSCLKRLMREMLQAKGVSIVPPAKKKFTN